MLKISFLLGVIMSSIFFLVISSKSINKDHPVVLKNNMEIVDSLNKDADSLFLSSDQTQTINIQY